MKNTSLKLVVGCDHAACDLKAKVIAHLVTMVRSERKSDTPTLLDF